MSSTYSNLKFELIANGEQSGAWGTTTNTNLGTAIEQAIVGMATLSSGDFTANVATLTLTNTNAAQNARALCLVISASSLSAAGTLNVPAIQKPYIIINNDSYAITVKVSGLTGVSVPAGKRTVVYNNGTDVGNQIDYLTGLTLGTALPVASGGTGSTSTTFVNLATNVTGTLPVANGGTGLTSTPANGALDIGNGTGFTRTTLTAGSGVTITNSAGGISIAATGSGGTVTAVTGTAPVASSGGTAPAISLAANYGDTQNPYASKTANYILAAPNGSAGAPTFRAIVAADIPTLNQNTTGTAANVTGIVAVANGGTNASTASGARTSLGLGTIATQDASAVAITGGSVNGTTVGATTASTGAFTTLSASSTVSGTGFSTYLASPPAIGGTAAAAGAFTTLSASSTVSGTGFSTYLASPPAIGGTTPAAITGTTVSDSIGNLRTIVQNSQTSAYVLVATDAGKHISITTGGVTVNASIFSVGQAITIFNNSASNQTITQGTSVTMYLAGTATTGNRTLAQRGVCTILCVASNTFVISGGGLT
jgi:hypothetical protein